MRHFGIVLDGSAGSIARFPQSGCVARQFGLPFPSEKLLVSVTGRFIIRFFAALTGQDGRWLIALLGRELFLIGFWAACGTFSPFSAQTINLTRHREWFKAGAKGPRCFVSCLLAVLFHSSKGL